MSIAERVSERSHAAWQAEHESRYDFAAAHARACRVLDIACGSGAGSASLLAAGAREVVAADLSFDTLRAIAPVEGLRRVRADGTRLPFADGAFDLVVTFETIEHLEDARPFLAELRRVLRPSGTLLLSTPNADFTRSSGGPPNPFHLHEFRPDELRDALRTHFAAIELLGQHVAQAFGPCPYWTLARDLPRDLPSRARVVAWKVLARAPSTAAERVSRLLWKRPMYPGRGDFAFTPDAVARAHDLLAVCR